MIITICNLIITDCNYNPGSTRASGRANLSESGGAKPRAFYGNYLWGKERLFAKEGENEKAKNTDLRLGYTAGPCRHRLGLSAGAENVRESAHHSHNRGMAVCQSTWSMALFQEYVHAFSHQPNLV